MQKHITLTKLGLNKSGIVVSIAGGHLVSQRLSAMGIRPGKKISKIGQMFLRGPVTIRVGNIDIALGHGTANKIIVEVEV